MNTGPGGPTSFAFVQSLLKKEDFRKEIFLLDLTDTVSQVGQESNSRLRSERPLKTEQQSLSHH